MTLDHRDPRQVLQDGGDVGMVRSAPSFADAQGSPEEGLGDVDPLLVRDHRRQQEERARHLGALDAVRLLVDREHASQRRLRVGELAQSSQICGHAREDLGRLGMFQAKDLLAHGQGAARHGQRLLVASPGPQNQRQIAQVPRHPRVLGPERPLARGQGEPGEVLRVLELVLSIEDHRQHLAAGREVRVAIVEACLPDGERTPVARFGLCVHLLHDLGLAQAGERGGDRQPVRAFRVLRDDQRATEQRLRLHRLPLAQHGFAQPLQDGADLERLRAVRTFALREDAAEQAFGVARAA